MAAADFIDVEARDGLCSLHDADIHLQELGVRDRYCGPVCMGETRGNN